MQCGRMEAQAQAWGFVLHPGVGMSENFQRQWWRRIPPAKHVVLWKVLGIKKRLAASHLNSQTLAKPTRIFLMKQMESEPEECGTHWKPHAFFSAWENTMNAKAFFFIFLQSPRCHRNCIFFAFGNKLLGPHFVVSFRSWKNGKTWHPLQHDLPKISSSPVAPSSLTTKCLRLKTYKFSTIITTKWNARPHSYEADFH